MTDQKTVLVVDDSESVCTAIAFLVQIDGHRAITAYDGREALEKARAHIPDVILLDIMMPVLDGWQTMRELRADPATRSIPVLALTALRLSQEQVDGAGFLGYLSKPVPAHRLTAEIRSACGG